MSVSYFAHALIEPTSEYRQMYAIMRMCDAANISYPAEVAEYFDDVYGIPASDGMCKRIPMSEKYDVDDDTPYLEVKMEDIPKDARSIRIYISV